MARFGLPINDHHVHPAGILGLLRLLFLLGKLLSSFVVYMYLMLEEYVVMVNVKVEEAASSFGLFIGPRIYSSTIVRGHG